MFTKKIGRLLGVCGGYILWVGLAFGQPTASGRTLAKELGCYNCHLGETVDNPLYEKIPKLLDGGQRYRSGYLHHVLQNGQAGRIVGTAARMPVFALSEAERNALTTYLLSRRVGELDSLYKFATSLRGQKDQDVEAVNRGRQRFRNEYACVGCHRLEGVGGTSAPALDEVGGKLQRDWVRAYLIDPKRVDPASQMHPLFYRPDSSGRYQPVRADRPVGEDLNDILAYLFRDEKAEGQVKAPEPKLVVAGEAIFQALRCGACHQQEKPEPFAPGLASASTRLSKSYLEAYLKKPHARRPFGAESGDGSRMPNFNLTDAEVTSLLAWFDEKTPKTTIRKKPAKLSPYKTLKAERFLKEKLSCLGCHAYGGDGGMIAPELTGAGGRLRPEYLHGAIYDPQRTMPHAVMPKIKGRPTPKTLDLIYRLLAQSEQQEKGGEYLDLTTHKTVTRTTDTRGAELYTRYCAMCHGETGGQDGFNARYLPVKPARLSDGLKMSKRPDDTIYDVLAVGGFVLGKSHRMPPWGETLSPSDLRSLVEYVRTLCQCEQPGWAGDDR